MKWRGTNLSRNQGTEAYLTRAWCAKLCCPAFQNRAPNQKRFAFKNASHVALPVSELPPLWVSAFLPPETALNNFEITNMCSFTSNSGWGNGDCQHWKGWSLCLNLLVSSGPADLSIQLQTAPAERLMATEVASTRKLCCLYARRSFIQRNVGYVDWYLLVLPNSCLLSLAPVRFSIS